MEGAAIPMPEITVGNITSFLSEGAGDSVVPDMDEFCEVLEKMARAELRAYANGEK